MTPMMEQWSQLKALAGESLLFFRLGDFYELFGDDAIKAAPLMGVTLTSRGKSSSDDPVPLCGVPVHNFETYLNRILDQGHCVALAEQVEEPGPGKKLVKRDIVQHFSPGVRLLELQDQAQYAACVCGNEKQWYLAAADVSTGHLVLETGDGSEALQDLIDRLPVKDLRTPFGESFSVQSAYQASYALLSDKESKRWVLKILQIVDAEDAPCKHPKEWQALGALFRLLQEMHPQIELFFIPPEQIPESVFMTAATRRHLHLFEPTENSLFQKLNETKTSSGRRALKLILSHPTRNHEEIKRRQICVQFWKKESWLRQQARQNLATIYDMPRILRLKKNPQRLFQLKNSLKNTVKLAELLRQHKEEVFNSFVESVEKLAPLIQKLESNLKESTGDHDGWIKVGTNSQIDELRELQKNAELYLQKFESELRTKLGVNTLKIRFHQVFGYVAELTRQHEAKIPADCKKIQSLANSIRFKNKELEELETKLLSLESRLQQAELAELEKLYSAVDAQRKEISLCSEKIGELDVFQAFAEVSSRESWSTPLLIENTESSIRLQNAVHPLTDEDFVPLSFELSSEAQRIMLLTGPNMAGKSTVLRIAALSALLHQIGSDLPAEAAELSLFDRIMCRMGAMDDLSQGKSTFFVEMKEVSSMLQGASPQSLLLFDEIGRGTSTFDGMSLAWAITEAVHELQCLSMVATHYLELAVLEERLKYLKNFHLGVQEANGQLVFTRKLKHGPANQSYGIQVARLAALPEKILARAETKLKEFETKGSKIPKPSPLFEWAERRVREC